MLRENLVLPRHPGIGMVWQMDVGFAKTKKLAMDARHLSGIPERETSSIRTEKRNKGTEESYG